MRKTKVVPVQETQPNSQAGEHLNAPPADLTVSRARNGGGWGWPWRMFFRIKAGIASRERCEGRRGSIKGIQRMGRGGLRAQVVKKVIPQGQKVRKKPEK